MMILLFVLHELTPLEQYCCTNGGGTWQLQYPLRALLFFLPTLSCLFACNQCKLCFLYKDVLDHVGWIIWA